MRSYDNALFNVGADRGTAVPRAATYANRQDRRDGARLPHSFFYEIPP
jgi:hypothetical protein